MRYLDIQKSVVVFSRAIAQSMKCFNFLTNDGYGQRDDQDPADGAAAPDHLAKARSGADVAVSDLGKINNDNSK